MADRRDPIHTDECECDAGWNDLLDQLDDIIRADLLRAYQRERLERALGIEGDR